MPPRKTPLRSKRRAIGLQQPQKFDDDERLRRNAVREAVIRRDRVCVLSPGTSNRRYYDAVVAQGVDPGRCFGDRETMHHLRKSSALGEYTFENLVLACTHHNEWVENFPPVARSAGLVIRDGDER